MWVSISGPDPLTVDARVVAIPVAEGASPRGPLGQRIGSMLADDGFRGEAGAAVLVHLPRDTGVERVAVGGLGPEVDADAVRAAARAVARLVPPVGGTAVSGPPGGR